MHAYSYDDGDFYVDGKLLKSRQAVAQWSRYAWEVADASDWQGHHIRQYTYDTTSQATLCSKAIKELKKLRQMEVNYEVEINNLPEGIRIGDRINIVDDGGALYLSARILKLETSICDQKQTATLGEYLLKGSGISAKVEELAGKFAAMAKDRTLYTWIAYADDAQGSGISLDPEGKPYLGTAVNQTEKVADISDPSVFTWSKVQGSNGEDAAVLRIDSSRGTVFKNNAVSTVLSAVIYRGAQRITDKAGLTAAFGAGAYLQWAWQRMGETSFGILSASDSRLSNDGFSLTISPDDVDTKVTFMCSLIV